MAPTTGLVAWLMDCVPTGRVVPTSGQVVDSTCECSGVSTSREPEVVALNYPYVESTTTRNV